MKLTGSAIDRYMRNPDTSVAVTLVYGPDRGLVSERCSSLGRAVVDDLSDPFSVVELSLSSLREDGARLDDEARAMSFGGGMRLVRVRGAGQR